MEQNDPPYFTLEHRVLAWNLLYDFAKSINKIDGFGLSPFLTTAFTYLLRFFNNKDILVKGKKEPEKDLFTLVVVSELVTSKQFFFIYKLDDFIRINFDYYPANNYLAMIYLTMFDKPNIELARSYLLETSSHHIICGYKPLKSKDLHHFKRENRPIYNELKYEYKRT